MRPATKLAKPDGIHENRLRSANQQQLPREMLINPRATVARLYQERQGHNVVATFLRLRYSQIREGAIHRVADGAGRLEMMNKQGGNSPDAMRIAEMMHRSEEHTSELQSPYVISY